MILMYVHISYEAFGSIFTHHFFLILFHIVLAAMVEWLSGQLYHFSPYQYDGMAYEQSTCGMYVVMLSRHNTTGWTGGMVQSRINEQDK